MFVWHSAVSFTTCETFVKTPTDKTGNFQGRADSMNFPSREPVHSVTYHLIWCYPGPKLFTNKPPRNRTNRAHAPSRLARCGRRGSARCSPGPPPPFRQPRCGFQRLDLNPQHLLAHGCELLWESLWCGRLSTELLKWFQLFSKSPCK